MDVVLVMGAEGETTDCELMEGTTLNSRPPENGEGAGGGLKDVGTNSLAVARI